MGRVYGDPVVVIISDEGRPVRFVWRDRLYVIRRIVEHWVASRDWWRESTDPADEDRGPREFWRVEAAEGDRAGVYELRYDAADGSWILGRVWS